MIDGKRVVLIIQARMGSSKLPGKSMMPLAGEPLVGRILERVKRCMLIDEIVLAIPDTANDNELADLGRRNGVTVFRGSEADVLDRYYRAAVQSRADLVLRIPADNPTPEPAEIDRIISFHASLGRPGFSTNLAQIRGSGYPDGIGAEIFDFALLEEAWKREPDSRRQEHVHLNFFDYSTDQSVDEAWCPVATIDCPSHFRRPDLVLDVNTSEQYQFMRELYDYLYPRNPQFTIVDTIKWYDTVYRPSMASSK